MTRYCTLQITSGRLEAQSLQKTIGLVIWSLKFIEFQTPLDKEKGNVQSVYWSKLQAQCTSNMDINAL